MEAMDRQFSVKEAGTAYAKEGHRNALRTLSYPEKVKVVVELQRIAAPVLRARGRAVKVWDLA